MIDYFPLTDPSDPKIAALGLEHGVPILTHMLVMLELNHPIFAQDIAKHFDL